MKARDAERCYVAVPCLKRLLLLGLAITLSQAGQAVPGSHRGSVLGQRPSAEDVRLRRKLQPDPLKRPATARQQHPELELRNDVADGEGLKIRLIYDFVPGVLDSDNEALLKSVVQRSADVISNLVGLKYPRTGPLFLSRVCDDIYELEDGSFKCGVWYPSDSASTFNTWNECERYGVRYQKDWFEDYEECFTDDGTDDSCEEVGGHAGLGDFDVVFFVRYDSCLESPNFVAWAFTCDQAIDQSILGERHFAPVWRSTSGILHMCPPIWESLSTYSPDDDAILRAVETMVHEILHVLGVATDLFPAYDGTPAGQGNLRPPLKTSIGTPASVITPNVVAAAREHFDCPTINSVPFENEGEDMSSSHWDSRYFQGELMDAAVSAAGLMPPLLTNITLALLEDTGWYNVNYTMASISRFGYKAGCDFLNMTCDEYITAHPEQSYFCDPALGVDQCTSDHRGTTLCIDPDYFMDGCTPRQYAYSLCDAGEVCVHLVDITGSPVADAPPTRVACQAIPEEDCDGGKFVDVCGPGSEPKTLKGGGEATLICPADDVCQPACPDDCNGRGNCFAGACQCFILFSGPSCAEGVKPSNTTMASSAPPRGDYLAPPPASYPSSPPYWWTPGPPMSSPPYWWTPEPPMSGSPPRWTPGPPMSSPPYWWTPGPPMTSPPYWWTPEPPSSSPPFSFPLFGPPLPEMLPPPLSTSPPSSPPEIETGTIETPPLRPVGESPDIAGPGEAGAPTPISDSPAQTRDVDVQGNPWIVTAELLVVNIGVSDFDASVEADLVEDILAALASETSAGSYLIELTDIRAGTSANEVLLSVSVSGLTETEASTGLYRLRNAAGREDLLYGPEYAGVRVELLESIADTSSAIRIGSTCRMIALLLITAFAMMA